MSGLLFDFLDEGEADVATDRADFFVVDQVCPAEDEADPGDDEEGVVVGGGGYGGGDDDAEEAEGDVEQVVAEADALGLFGFEFVVFSGAYELFGGSNDANQFTL
jgi:hypothetical protein